jgi:hypothetical protein
VRLRVVLGPGQANQRQPSAKIAKTDSGSISTARAITSNATPLTVQVVHHGMDGLTGPFLAALLNPLLDQLPSRPGLSTGTNSAIMVLICSGVLRLNRCIKHCTNIAEKQCLSSFPSPAPDLRVR